MDKIELLKLGLFIGAIMFGKYLYRVWRDKKDQERRRECVRDWAKAFNFEYNEVGDSRDFFDTVLHEKELPNKLSPPIIHMTRSIEKKGLCFFDFRVLVRLTRTKIKSAITVYQFNAEWLSGFPDFLLKPRDPSFSDKFFGSPHEVMLNVTDDFTENFSLYGNKQRLKTLFSSELADYFAELYPVFTFEKKNESLFFYIYKNDVSEIHDYDEARRFEAKLTMLEEIVELIKIQVNRVEVSAREGVMS
ncbi:hypothetical protein FUAX_19440 [Fulvitalea axinellae]|uniref:DUF3137 domain-containing protein n=1 Tax=Fulvitalea axinellae TaxID=1182444 RepID=A0AAU9CRA9_9BACT|nr:hypothetical protein FUAX_19440 [Fulvitalea axinellae]